MMAVVSSRPRTVGKQYRSVTALDRQVFDEAVRASAALRPFHQHGAPIQCVVETQLLHLARAFQPVEIVVSDRRAGVIAEQEGVPGDVRCPGRRFLDLELALGEPAH